MSSGEYCGERMIAAIFETPALASDLTPPMIDGSEKRMPTSTGHSSASAKAAACLRVISTSGEPPMTR